MFGGALFFDFVGNLNFLKNKKETIAGSAFVSAVGAPDMGNNLAVKVRYALGSRKH